MAKVMEIVRLTLIPMSCAASRSSETARMDLPILVLPVNRVRPTMMTTQARTVTITSPVMVRPPPNSTRGFMVTMLLKFLGAEPKISCAAFCRK